MAKKSKKTKQKREARRRLKTVERRAIRRLAGRDTITMPAGAETDAVRAAHEDDLAFFASHPDATERVRPAGPESAIMFGPNQVSRIRVRRTEKEGKMQLVYEAAAAAP